MQIELGALDYKLLKLLQHNADLTTAELADAVGLSQSPCWRRICRLEKNGVIRKKVALLDNEKLGMGVVIFTSINLSSHHGKTLKDRSLEHDGSS